MARPKMLYGMQVGRGLAAMLVVLFHTTVALSSRGLAPAFPQGAAGVDIFFVISGFVIYLTGRKLAWREFFARRVARVVPLYWFFLTLKLGVILWLGNDPTRSIDDPLFVIGSYLFIPVFRESMGGVYPLIVAGWTLNYEMYFYLVTAIVLGVLPRRHFPLGLTVYMVAAAIGSLFLRDSISPESAPPIVLLEPLCLEFIAGLWIAVLWTRGMAPSKWLAAICVGIGVLSLVLMPGEHAGTPMRIVFWGIPAAVIVFGLVNLEPFVGFRHWGPALVIGDASYSIYLAHTAVLPVLDILVRRMPANGLLQGGTLLLGSALAGVVVWRVIERPLTDLASRLLRLHVRNPAPQSATSA